MNGNKMIQSQIFCKAFATIRHSNSHQFVRHGRNTLILWIETALTTAEIFLNSGSDAHPQSENSRSISAQHGGTARHMQHLSGDDPVIAVHASSRGSHVDERCMFARSRLRGACTTT